MRRTLLTLALAAAPLSAQTSSIAAVEAARSMQLTPGSWSYRQSPTGSVSQHGANLAIRCNRAARTVTIERPQPATSPSRPLTVTTDTLSRALPPSGTLGIADPLLDAIAFSRGRFIVTGGTAERLVLPAWPDAARSIEDCRN